MGIWKLPQKYDKKRQVIVRNKALYLEPPKKIAKSD
jgi:hypothetical protein